MTDRKVPCVIVDERPAPCGNAARSDIAPRSTSRGVRPRICRGRSAAAVVAAAVSTADGIVNRSNTRSRAAPVFHPAVVTGDVELSIAPVILVLYGVGAWAFAKRVLPRWPFYVDLGEGGGWQEGAQFLIGFLCAGVWPVAWRVLARAADRNADR